MEQVRRVRIVYSIYSVCLVILGFSLLIWPDMATEIFCRLCGIMLMGLGIAKLVSYFSRDFLELDFRYDFAMGLASILIGFIMVFWWRQFLDILVVAIGLFMVIDALFRMQASLDAKKAGEEHWWVYLIIAIVTAAIGTILFIQPFQWSVIVAMALGISLIIDGLLNLYVAIKTASVLKDEDEALLSMLNNTKW